MFLTRFKYVIVFIFLACVLIGRSFAFSFAVAGDNRDGDEIFKTIIQEINKDKEISFVVNTGDLTPLSREREYKKYSQMIGRSKAKFYNVIGNHDIKFGGSRLFESFFGPKYYSWDFENNHFIVLDNVSQRGLGKNQYDWLINDLEINKAKNKFVFLHKPLFDVTGSFPDEIMYPRKSGRDLVSLFEKNKVKMVCWGHIHGYGRDEKNGIVYILTGGGGAPLYLPYFSGGFHHYVKVTVKGNVITDKMIEIEMQKDNDENRINSTR